MRRFSSFVAVWFVCCVCAPFAVLLLLSGDTSVGVLAVADCGPVCAAGTYYASGFCTTCPAGSYCPTNSTTPTPCDAGTARSSPSATQPSDCIACGAGHYSAAGATACTACPGGSSCSATAITGTCVAGQFAPQGSGSCQACASGSYSAASAAACTQCPAGFACSATGITGPCAAGQYAPLGGGSCLACASGTYSLGSAASCSVCDAGSSCATQNAAPVQCGLGFYAPTASSACVQCPAGHACPLPSRTPTACPSGTYALLGQGYCAACPAGSACSDPTSLPVACNATTEYSFANSTSCTTCPAGWTCPSVNGVGLARCGTGHWSAAGDRVCRACAAGQTSTSTGSGCQQCTAGSYNTASGSSCTPCPPGSSCAVTSQSPVACTQGYYAPGNSTLCLPCTNGTVSAPNFAQCVPCSPGFACADPTANPVACSPGYYSLSGATQCTICPAGYACPSTSGAPQACPAGTFANAGSTSCSSCAAGSACPSPTQAAIVCQPGNYTLPGDVACRTCPAGSMCPTPATAPVACAAGTYALSMSTTCTMCPAGSACPSVNAAPVACPSGTWSTAGSVSCRACPAGYSCSNSALAPLACPAGYYALTNSTSCLPCPAGFACPTSDAVPAQCQPGSFALTMSTNCTSCPAGFECPDTTGVIAMRRCAPGNYSAGGQSACTVCPAGSACPYHDQAVVIPCAPGSYARAGSASCTICPPGYACGDTTGTLLSPCANGYISAGGQAACFACPAGAYCPNATLSLVIPCADGYFSTGGATACQPCPAGFACPDKAAALPNVGCATGSYSMGLQTTCTPCPAGFSCSNIAVTGPCAAGSYQTGGFATCTPCTNGNYCPDPTLPALRCPMGYYSGASATSCTICPPGYQCSDPAVPPQQCAAGYYSVNASLVCTPCSPGYACPAGSTSPTPSTALCPVGSYCPDGQRTIPCPAGTYGNSTGLISSDECLPCPAGLYCPGGTTTSDIQAALGGSSTSLYCSAGCYCPMGTRQACDNPCPAGTLHNLTAVTGCPALSARLTIVEQCVACPAGYYCSQGTVLAVPAATNPPQLCPSGYYCPMGTSSSTQFPCPAGTYNPNTGSSDISACVTCPVGRYCPGGSSSPTQCDVGTYNPDQGAGYQHNCLPCPPGFSCATVGLSNYNFPCAVGHYCPLRTGAATSYPCPPGTFTDSTNLTSVLYCNVCWQGYACPAGTGGVANPPTPCSQGHYCPGVPYPSVAPQHMYGAFNGSRTTYTTEFPCLPGTYTAATNLYSASQCTDCPAGQWCRGGQSAPTGPCQAGYYCPLRSTVANANPCPAGTYSNRTDLTQPSECTPCPPGSFCPLGSSAPVPCYNGTYTNVTNTVSGTPTSQWGTGSCAVCPEGYRCPVGTVQPDPCPSGTFSASMGDSCPTCPAGYYCPASASGWTRVQALHTCPAGLYCPPAMSAAPAAPANSCPVGKYCPSGTPSPVNCPPGTFNPVLGLAAQGQCQTCTAGYYCLEGSVNVTGPCQPGSYCPPGSSGPFQEPCPAGTYSPTPAANSTAQCLLCPAGQYCPRGTASPLICPIGSYCAPGAGKPTPCPLGSYGNRTGLRNVEECNLCDPGYFCDTPGLSTSRGKCDPGYYCRLGAYTSAPSGLDSTGGLCPPGGYCPVGSYQATPCPPGQFNNFTGASTAQDCSPCTPGFYCAGLAQSTPTALCLPGYYCTGGATTGIQNISPAGYYSLAGASAPVPCDPGTYQPNVASSTCLLCPGGFVCRNQSTIYLQDCPAGHYCVNGTFNPTQCPMGTYNPLKNSASAAACLSCPAGYYCGAAGLSAVSGPCAPGFVCTGSSTLPTPVAKPFGDECQPGYYCPNATAIQMACPAGYYYPATRATALSNCIMCPPGQYCGTSGLPGPTGPCAGGYYCNANSDVSQPPNDFRGGICPAGTYCPPGSSTPLGCPEGYYSPGSGYAACLGCPPGFYCPVNTTVPLPCPLGRYCPANTTTAQPKCPAGTIGNNTQYSSISNCILCPGGQFCSQLGLITPNGQCNSRYYCFAGALDANGNTILGGTGGICPAGFYCGAGTMNPAPCPSGTFSAATGLATAGECVPCTPGRYCDTPGRTTVTNQCAAGHYCTSGALVAAPVDGVTGNICPPGSYCPTGSASPQPCLAGTYTNVTGQSVCQTCVASYYCPQGTAFPENFPCPAGYYCPPGTSVSTQYACPNGTFSSLTARSSISSCTPCTPGSYCGDVGLATPTGPCAGGYVCFAGSAIATPNDNVRGFRCSPGTLCPAGSTSPLPCTAGSFCADYGLATPSGSCSAGYYCPPYSNNTVPQPPAYVCPPGFYCPPGSSAPSPCAPGYYFPVSGGPDASFCIRCPAGSYCNSSGLANPSGPCQAGYYCPEGSTSPNPIPCPIGFSCPTGSSMPVPCPDGSYQDLQGQAVCNNCTAGYFCRDDDLANQAVPVTRHDCPTGHYCPMGTTFGTQFPCPPGTLNNVSNVPSLAGCISCPAGSYCESPGLATPTGPCAAGFYCSGRSQSISPIDGVTGNICPPGHYCEAGSSVPTACPPGTYSNTSGNTNVFDCKTCFYGHYCSGGLVIPCTAGFVCTDRSWTPTPASLPAGYPCPAGHYCPAASGVERNCQPGTYQPDTQQSTCLPCVAGYVCPTVNMTVPVDCPIGSYCPTGSAAPLPCPVGTYSNRTNLVSASNCTACPTGSFCDSLGRTSPTGPCSAGYFCTSGSTTPAPTGTYPANGRCPAGSYCLTGTTAPTPCAAGTFLSTTYGSQASDCMICTGGMACTAAGLSAPDFPCAAGHYCPPGQLTTTPPSFTCAPGTQCPSGSVVPRGCPNGSYQPNPVMGSCLPCPAGSYCINNSTNPITCPQGFYCPLSTGIPILCANGTYGAAPALQSQDSCTACPPGRYCTNGVVTGQCAPGFLCLTSQPRPDPPVSDFRGGPCPAGHYCPLGSGVAVACPSGTVLPRTGGYQLSQCGPCPAGFICLPGDAFPRPCPPGQYCPSAQDALDCPAGTWSPSSMAVNISTCLSCIERYYCPVEGMSSGTTFPCTPGHYCPRATIEPVACALGSYRNDSLGASQSDCTQCPGGYRCGEGVTGPTPCPTGTYCPAGSSAALICPQGRWCLERTATPNPCPSAYYCPAGTSNPLPCPTGYYCPNNTALPILCPYGYYMKENAKQTNFDDTCAQCPAGSAGVVPDRTSCTVCAPGYVCLAGATSIRPTNNATQNGYECPLGYYCPEGSAAPTGCPAGTFGASTRLMAEGNCTKCVSNTYNDRPGQKACFPCGSSSRSGEGASTCECVGANRVFQKSDGSCICKPGYRFISDSFQVSTQDSTIDCEAKVYPRCGSGELRNATGECSNACANACGPGQTGTLSPTSTICECTGIQNENQVCDENCRLNSYQVVLDPTTNRILVLKPGTLSTYTNNGTTTQGISPSAIVASYPVQGLSSGNVDCRATYASTGGLTPTCSIHLMRSYDAGTMGIYNPSLSYLTAVFTNSSTSTVQLSTTRRRLLQSASSSQSGVNQPVLCVQLGEAVVWDVSDPSRTHYPVYSKDSLLNSNPNFDYGEFRRLADLMRSGIEMTTFAFSFNDPGSYVFSDYASSEKLTIINVLGANQQCPSSARITPMTTSNLVSLGVRRNNNILLSPDWVLIGILIGGMILLLAGLVGALYYFRRNRWGRQTSADAPYKKKALKVDFTKFSSKGSRASQRVIYNALLARPSDVLAKVAAVDAAAGPITSPILAGAAAPAGSLPRMGSADPENPVASGWPAAAAAATTTTVKGTHKVQEYERNLPALAVDGTDALRAHVPVISEAAFRNIFWDFERQIDLEAFDVNTFYDKLDKQARDFADRLEDANARALGLYKQISNQTRAIRNMITNKGDDADELTEEDLPDDRTLDQVRAALDTEVAARDMYSTKRDQLVDEIDDLVQQLGDHAARMGEEQNFDLAEEAREIFDLVQDRRRMLEEEIHKERERQRIANPEFRADVGDTLAERVMTNNNRLRAAEDAMLSDYGRLANNLEDKLNRMTEIAVDFNARRERMDVDQLNQLAERLKNVDREIVDAVEVFENQDEDTDPRDLVDEISRESEDDRREARRLLVNLIKKSNMQVTLSPEDMERLMQQLRNLMATAPLQEKRRRSDDTDASSVRSDEDGTDRDVLSPQFGKPTSPGSFGSPRVAGDHSVHLGSPMVVPGVRDLLPADEDDEWRRDAAELANAQERIVNESVNRIIAGETAQLEDRENEAIAELERTLGRKPTLQEINDIRDRFEDERRAMEERARQLRDQQLAKLAARRRKQAVAQPSAADIEQEYVEDVKREADRLQQELEAEVADARRSGASEDDIRAIQDRYELERAEMAERLRRLKDEQLARLRKRMLKDPELNDAAAVAATGAIELEDAKASMEAAVVAAAASGAPSEELERLREENRRLLERLEKATNDAVERAQERLQENPHPSQAELEHEYQADLATDAERLKKEMRKELAAAMSRGASSDEIDAIKDRYEREREAAAKRLAALKDAQLARLHARLAERGRQPSRESGVLSPNSDADQEAMIMDNIERLNEDMEAEIADARRRGLSEADIAAIQERYEREKAHFENALRRLREDQDAMIERRRRDRRPADELDRVYDEFRESMAAGHADIDRRRDEELAAAAARGADDDEMARIRERYEREREAMLSRLMRQREQQEQMILNRLGKRKPESQDDLLDAIDLLNAEEERELAAAAAAHSNEDEMARIRERYAAERSELERRLLRLREEQEKRFRERLRGTAAAAGAAASPSPDGARPTSVHRVLSDPDLDDQQLARIDSQITNTDTRTQEIVNAERDRICQEFLARFRSRRQAQLEEKAAVERDMRVEEDERVLEIEEDSANMLEEQNARIDLALDKELAEARERGASPEEMSRIRERYEREREAAQRRIMQMRDEQLANVRKVMTEKREQALKALEQQKQEEVAEMKDQKEAGLAELERILSDCAGDQAELASRVKKLRIHQQEDLQRRLQERLRKKREQQDAERDALVRETDRDARTALEFVARWSQRVHDSEAQRLKQEEEAALRAASNESERDRVRERFNEERLALDQRLAADRERQLAQQREYLEARKLKRQMQVAAKHKREQEREVQALENEVKLADDAVATKVAPEVTESQQKFTNRLGLLDQIKTMARNAFLRQENEKDRQHEIESGEARLLSEKHLLEEMELARRRAEVEQAAAAAETAAAREQILSSFETEKQTVFERQMREREQQQRIIEEKIARRRADLERKRREKEAEEQRLREEEMRLLKEEEERLAAQRRSEAAVVAATAMSVAAQAEAQLQQQRLQLEMERMRQEVEAQERLKIEQALRVEEEEQKRQQAALASKFDEERRNVVARSLEEQAALESQLQLSKERQLEKLQRDMALRKRRKELQLQQQMDERLRQEGDRLRDEHRAAALAKEKAELENALREGTVTDTREHAELIMMARHRREMDELVAAQRANEAERVRRAIETEDTVFMAELNALADNYDQLEAAALDDDDRRAKQQQREQAIRDMRVRHEHDLDSLRDRIRQQVEMDNRKEIVKLMHTQMMEVAQLVSGFSPEDIRAAQESEKLRRELERTKAEWEAERVRLQQEMETKAEQARREAEAAYLKTVEQRDEEEERRQRAARQREEEARQKENILDTYEAEAENTKKLLDVSRAKHNAAVQKRVAALRAQRAKDRMARQQSSIDQMLEGAKQPAPAAEEPSAAAPPPVVSASATTSTAVAAAAETSQSAAAKLPPLAVAVAADRWIRASVEKRRSLDSLPSVARGKSESTAPPAQQGLMISIPGDEETTATERRSSFQRSKDRSKKRPSEAVPVYTAMSDEDWFRILRNSDLYRKLVDIEGELDRALQQPLPVPPTPHVYVVGDPSAAAAANAAEAERAAASLRQLEERQRALNEREASLQHEMRQLQEKLQRAGSRERELLAKERELAEAQRVALERERQMIARESEAEARVLEAERQAARSAEAAAAASTTTTSTANRMAVVFADNRESQWPRGERLVPADASTLQPAHFVIYKFGQHLVDQLVASSAGKIDAHVTVLVADELPPTTNTSTAYHNSVHVEGNTIFVRKERLQGAGEFVLAMVHTVAHMAVGADVDTDYDPRFTMEFYRLLRTVCQEYFGVKMKRDAPGDSTGSAAGRSAGGSQLSAVGGSSAGAAPSSDATAAYIQQMMRKLPDADSGTPFSRDELARRLDDPSMQLMSLQMRQALLDMESRQRDSASAEEAAAAQAAVEAAIASSSAGGSSDADAARLESLRRRFALTAPESSRIQPPVIAATGDALEAHLTTKARVIRDDLENKQDTDLSLFRDHEKQHAKIKQAEAELQEALDAQASSSRGGGDVGDEDAAELEQRVAACTRALHAERNALDVITSKRRQLQASISTLKREVEETERQLAEHKALSPEEREERNQQFRRENRPRWFVSPRPTVAE